MLGPAWATSSPESSMHILQSIMNESDSGALPKAQALKPKSVNCSRSIKQMIASEVGLGYLELPKLQPAQARRFGRSVGFGRRQQLKRHPPWFNVRAEPC